MSMVEQPNDACCDFGGGILRADLPEEAVRLASAGFRRLWRRDAVSPEDLLPDDGAAVAVASALVERGRAELDGAGRVVGIHGLTLRETRHRFVHDGVAHNTWCAFDSIGIPAALALDAVAHTDCPACGRVLRVGFHGGEPEKEELALWLPAPADGHLMAQFCASADLYCSIDHLEQRIDTAKTPGTALDLAAAAALGRTTWADVSGSGADSATARGGQAEGESRSREIGMEIRGKR